MYKECTNKTNSLDGAMQISAEQTVIIRFDCLKVKEVSFIKKKRIDFKASEFLPIVFACMSLNL